MTDYRRHGLCRKEKEHPIPLSKRKTRRICRIVMIAEQYFQFHHNHVSPLQNKYPPVPLQENRVHPKVSAVEVWYTDVGSN
jgi:hypothetical protein